MQDPEAFACMFCGATIEEQPPLRVELSRRPWSDGPLAVYWAHVACLRERADPAIAGYIDAWQQEEDP